MSNDRDIAGTSRRDLFKIASVSAAAAGALFGGFGFNPLITAAMAKEAGRSTNRSRPPSPTPACRRPGARRASRRPSIWGKLFNVEVTWFDGELDAHQAARRDRQHGLAEVGFRRHPGVRHRHADRPVNKMIEAGIPVIDMDTLIAPLDQINVHSFLAPDNEFMGASVTQALVDAIGGEGTIVMTQGALGHTGAQGRAQGFESRGQEVSRRSKVLDDAAGRLGRDQGVRGSGTAC